MTNLPIYTEKRPSFVDGEDRLYLTVCLPGDKQCSVYIGWSGLSDPKVVASALRTLSEVIGGRHDH